MSGSRVHDLILSRVSRRTFLTSPKLPRSNRSSLRPQPAFRFAGAPFQPGQFVIIWRILVKPPGESRAHQLVIQIATVQQDDNANRPPVAVHVLHLDAHDGFSERRPITGMIAGAFAQPGLENLSRAVGGARHAPSGRSRGAVLIIIAFMGHALVQMKMSVPPRRAPFARSCPPVTLRTFAHHAVSLVGSRLFPRTLHLVTKLARFRHLRPAVRS